MQKSKLQDDCDITHVVYIIIGNGIIWKLNMVVRMNWIIDGKSEKSNNIANFILGYRVKLLILRSEVQKYTASIFDGLAMGRIGKIIG